jgi:hypothetical protein
MANRYPAPCAQGHPSEPVGYGMQKTPLTVPLSRV